MLSSIKPGDKYIASSEEAKKINGCEQKNQTETPKLTNSQQRKRDALDMAELIYNIYTSSCPISSKVSAGKANEDGQ